MILLLTVGTGTAGRYSFLAEGLIASIRLSGVERVVLVPSTAAESIEVARYVLADSLVTAIWEPLDHADAFPCFREPDDLESCRQHLLEIIVQVRQCGYRNIRLNPTSGTKQMSAAAILAGLEARIAKIDYTVGERSDGVVRTGTERLQVFDPDLVFCRRALEDALTLMYAGAFSGVSELLRPYSHHSRGSCLRSCAQMMEAWSRLQYSEAARCARSIDLPDARLWAKRLDRLACAQEFDSELFTDLFDLASFCLDYRSPETALATLYRATEHLAKVVLARSYKIFPPYRVAAFEKLLPMQSHRLRAIAFDGYLHLGLFMAMDCLRALDEPIGEWFFTDQTFLDLLELRHQTPFGHGLGSVECGDVEQACRRLHAAVRENTTIPAAELRRCSIMRKIVAFFKNSDS